MRVATAALLPNSPTFSSGTFTAGANAALVVDGVTLAVNDRVLVKDQGNTGSTRNGIYVVTTAGSVSVPWVITRATDADTSAEVLSGMRVRVTEGTQNAQTEWALATTGAITLDTTVLAFIQTAFAAAWLPVRVATTAVLPQSGTYGSKAFSALSNAALVIDGVTLAVGDRVLVKDQGDSTNGIFVVTNAGSAGSTWAMRRATDAFVSQQFLSGMSVRVSEGTANGTGQFYLATTGAITLDTTTLTFSASSLTDFNRHVSGYWHREHMGGAAAGAALLNAFYLGGWWYIPRTITIDKVALQVTSAGSAGVATARISIWALDPSGFPTGAALADIGAIDVGSTGVKTATFGSPVQLTPGWYAFGVEMQGTPVTAAQVYQFSGFVGGGPGPLGGNSSSPGGFGAGWFYSGAASGAAPSITTASVGVTGGGRPLVWYHASSIP